MRPPVPGTSAGLRAPWRKQRDTRQPFTFFCLAGAWRDGCAAERRPADVPGTDDLVHNRTFGKTVCSPTPRAREVNQSNDIDCSERDVTPCVATQPERRLVPRRRAHRATSIRAYRSRGSTQRRPPDSPRRTHVGTRSAQSRQRPALLSTALFR